MLQWTWFNILNQIVKYFEKRRSAIVAATEVLEVLCCYIGCDLVCHLSKMMSGSRGFAVKLHWAYLVCHLEMGGWAYDEHMVRRCFKCVVNGELGDGIVNLIIYLPVQTLTPTQGTPEWFLLRQFALTSSTSDKAIGCCNGTENYLERRASWSLIKGILKGVGSRDATPPVQTALKLTQPESQNREAETNSDITGRLDGIGTDC